MVFAHKLQQDRPVWPVQTWNSTFTYCLQLETEGKVIPFISKLFWETHFFPHTSQLEYSAALNASVLYRLISMEIGCVDP